MTVFGWDWDSAARGVALGGVIMCADRNIARYLIGQEMRMTGAISALARQVEYDADWGVYRPTGLAMIAFHDGRHAEEVRWRDVADG